MKNRNTNNKHKVTLPPPTNKRTELTPFLKAINIAKEGITQITFLGDMRESTGRYGEGIDVVCELGGKRYLFTIKFGSVNYSLLYERFGTGKWEGVVSVERREYMGNEYVAVVG